MSVLNMVGKTCPIPVIEAKKALREAAPGSEVQVLVDNDVARQNLARMANNMNAGFSFEKQEDNHILVTITAQEACTLPDEGKGLVVAIGSATMGGGDDELGAILMKGFIYSLTELDTPPESVLFYNGGIHLTTGNAQTLDDLRTLEESGTMISSCGACLNYHEKLDELAVGTVTNMYAITTTMAGAAHLINL